jgi:Flp pilus assembly protein CpaB
MTALADLSARLGGWPRRVAAIVLLLAALATGVGTRQAPASPASAVVVAARDLPAGAELAAGDVETAAWASGTSPPAALTRAQDALGRRTAGALARGEPITTTRLVGPGLATGLPAGEVAVAVQVTGATSALVRPGDRVRLLAAPAVDGGAATTIADPALVLAVLPAASGGTDQQSPSLVVAVMPGSLNAVAAATASGRLVLAAVMGDP